jgi:hypothetical protein
MTTEENSETDEVPSASKNGFSPKLEIEVKGTKKPDLDKRITS